MSTLDQNSATRILSQVVACKKCPRLRQHCESIATIKRRQYLHEPYWGKPVPGFGDRNASVWIIGLAPAAHGANRTGRMFTGDQSGLWLYRALHRANFSNQEISVSNQDGLELRDCYVSAIVRCAPPQNRPEPIEIAQCRTYLQAERVLLKHLKVVVCLGNLALQGAYDSFPEIKKSLKKRPKFVHGGEWKIDSSFTVISSYHPSQQNTFTKKLTEPMFDRIFARVKVLAG